MYHVRNHYVEAIENRQDENHSEGGDADAYYRNPRHNVDEVVTFLREKITLRYEYWQFQFNLQFTIYNWQKSKDESQKSYYHPFNTFIILNNPLVFQQMVDVFDII